jgi:PAS domain S-box-containing protein
MDSNYQKILPENSAAATLNHIIEGIRDHFYILDYDWNFRFVNRNTASILGKEPNDLIGKCIWETYPRLKGTIVEDNYRAAMTNREIRQFILKGIYREKFYFLDVTPYDEGIIVMANDITEQKNIEEFRKKTEENFRIPLDSMTEVFQVIELRYNNEGKADGYFMKVVNPAFEKITGKSRDELIGKESKEVFGTVEDHWIEIFESVDITGKALRRSNYSSAFNRWFEVYAWKTGEKTIASIITDITERKLIEKRLEESEERFRSILNNSQDVIYCVKLATGNYEYISPSCENIIGYTAEELKALDPVRSLEMVHPHFRQVLMEAKINSEKYGESKSEYLQKTKYGDYRWLSNHMTISRDSEGNPQFRYGNIWDITDVKKNESALRKLNHIANEHLNEIENLYNSVPIGLAVLDLDLRFLKINERLAEINGVSAQDHIGKTIKELLPDMYDTSVGIVERILETGQSQLGIEFQGITASHPGIIRSWSEDWIPLRNQSGEIFRISVVVIETTQQRRSREELLINEKKLKLAKQALERSQEKLNMALENGRIGIFERNLKTNRLRWDKRTVELFGLKEDSFNGNLSTFRRHINEEDLALMKDAVKKAISTGEPYEVVYRTIPVNGESKYIAEKALIIKNSKGKPVKIMGVCFDVSDMKRGAEKIIMKMNEELLRSNRELQQFAYVASHDLQEPLRMVSSFTQLLQQRYFNQLDDDANEFINYAVEGSKRMYDLLNGLLSYSRVQTAGKEFRQVDLKQVVTTVKDNLRLVIEKTNTVIRYEGLPVISADESQMIRLMQNLIENAIKFCKSDPHIKIKSETSNSHFIISVQDNGIGIEPQYFEKIFRIFQRLHNSKEYAGTGIGLSICQRIIERHGGRIWVSSVPGEGSEFTFSIPCNSNEK